MRPCECSVLRIRRPGAVCARFVEGALKGRVFVSDLNALFLTSSLHVTVTKCSACCLLYSFHSSYSYKHMLCRWPSFGYSMRCPCMHSSVCMPEMLPVQDTCAAGIRFSGMAMVVCRASVNTRIPDIHRLSRTVAFAVHAYPMHSLIGC